MFSKLRPSHTPKWSSKFYVIVESLLTAWTDLPSKTQELSLVFSKWMLEIMWDPSGIYISTFETNPQKPIFQILQSRMNMIMVIEDCGVDPLHKLFKSSYLWRLLFLLSSLSGSLLHFSLVHDSPHPRCSSLPSFKTPLMLLQNSATNLCDLFSFSLENSGACVLSQKI